MNVFTSLVVRERWEHPALWIVPAVFAGVCVLAAAIAAGSGLYHFGFPGIEIREFAAEAAEIAAPDRRELLRMGLLSFAVAFNGFLVGVMFFYALGSLYDDRRDRSILFWKSLPVSDVETVLSKLATALLLAPALTFVVVAIVQLLALVTAAGILLVAGADGWYLVLDPLALGGAWLTLLWGLLAQSLVFMPFVAWLMLASAWARKAPFLWAVVPPAAVIMLEMWFFRDSRLGLWIAERFDKALPLAFEISPRTISLHGRSGAADIDGALQVRFDLLWSYELWSGIVVAAVLLAGAVWLRRHRADPE